MFLREQDGEAKEKRVSRSHKLERGREVRGKGTRQRYLNSLASPMGKRRVFLARGVLGLSKALHSFYLDCRIINLSSGNMAFYSRGTKKAGFWSWSCSLDARDAQRWREHPGGERSQGFSQNGALLKPRCLCLVFAMQVDP